MIARADVARADAARVGTARADTCAVVVAGGTGERFGDPRGKQFVPLCGLPLAAWSMLAFEASPSVASIVVVCAPEREEQMRADVLATVSLTKPVAFASSGSSRQESCLSGIRRVPDGTRLVAIHDAARPLVLPTDVERVIASVRDDDSLDGAICALPAVDTLKIAADGLVTATPDRSDYWYAQTPQVFRYDAILAAHERAAREGFVGTDDASLVEHFGGRVRCVASSRDNIKVTLPEDLAVAEGVLKGRAASQAAAERGGRA